MSLFFDKFFKTKYINQAVYNIEWYEYPPSLRKHLVIMMMRTQKPTHIKGFKMITCSLETFMSVSRHNIFLNLFFFAD